MSASAAGGGVAVGAVDSITGDAIGISQGHHEVHEGKAFTVNVDDVSMADNDTIILAFKTPAAPRVHMLSQFTTLVGGDLVLWEAPTWTAESGASAAIINRKREAAMSSSGILADEAQAGFLAADVMHANPTGLNTGAAIEIQHLLAWGVRNQSAAGESRDVHEIVLKPSTQYAAVFTAEGGSNKGQLTLSWYEHTDSA